MEIKTNKKIEKNKKNLQAVGPSAFVLRRGGRRLANSIPGQGNQSDRLQSFFEYFALRLCSEDYGLVMFALLMFRICQ